MKITTLLRFENIRALAQSVSDALIQIQTGWNVNHALDGSHKKLTFTGDTQTTVGAAGSASALPANPTGYMVITIGTTEVVVPYYAKS